MDRMSITAMVKCGLKVSWRGEIKKNNKQINNGSTPGAGYKEPWKGRKEATKAQPATRRRRRWKRLRSRISLWQRLFQGGGRGVRGH